MNVSPPEPLRILYVITKANWGGAQRYVFDLIEGARAAGHQPLLAFGEQGLLSERLEALGIATIRVPGLVRDPSPSQDWQALQELIALNKKIRPDVIHLNSSKAGLLGALAGRAAGVRRVIFTAHGWAFTEPRSRVSRAIFVVLHYLTVFLAHRTIAVSHAVASATHEWPFVQKKIVTIYLGAHPQTLLPREQARAALAQKDSSLSPSEDAFWVGTIAELHKNKGLDIGIEGWRETPLPGASWVILGGGEEDASLRAQATDVQGIHFMGFVPDAATYLSAFDLFLLPSRTEALGYVLVEAGMASVPVLASEVGGIPEVVANDERMLFPAGDAHALAKKLQHVYVNRADLTARGTIFNQLVRKKFSLGRMVAETLALYR